MAGIVVGRGGLEAGHASGQIKADYETLYGQAMTMALVRRVIRERYVEEVDDKRIVQGALRGMASSLDDYSEYMDGEEYDDLRMESEGEFEGIGIVAASKAGWIEVITPMTGAPAARAGVMPGDRIIEIEGKPTLGMSMTEASSLLRGRQGTAVTFKIARPDRAEPLSLTVMREKIRTPSVYAELLAGGTGYVRLSVFQEDSPEEFEKAMESLAGKGANAIVLDLRNNGGGLLDAAIRICDMLLESGTIVSIKGRGESENQEWKASGKGSSLKLPLAVLVNEGSASAAEIVAGAVSDNSRGKLVGTPTFGKGSVQTIIPLSDGSALKLTTALYHTPSGRTFSHEKDGYGLKPDFETPLKPEQRDRVFRSLSNGVPDPEGDPQLAKAIEILGAR